MLGGLPSDLRQALGQLAVRRPDLSFDVRWVECAPSTMDLVARGAEAGVPAGFVVIADQQTAGRGRRGRSWCSPPGAGLYFSLLARPARHAELLTLAAGVGVVGGITAATGLRAHLKWPNDVVVGARKLAGVLAEGAHVGDPDVSVTIGVGLNLEPAAYPPDVAARATSVHAELGRGVDRFQVFAALLEHMTDALLALEAGDASGILQAWRSASPTAAGTPVSWIAAGRPQAGVTAGLDETGALLVRTPSGIERVIAGELQWDLAVS